MNPLKHQRHEKENLYRSIRSSHLALQLYRTGPSVIHFRQFRNEKNVTYINLPKSLIKMGLKSSNDKTADALAAQIDGIQILTLEAASQKTRDAFCKRFNGLEEKSYEPMVKTNDGGEKVRILVKGNEKEVQSLVILAIDKDDCSLIKINGHINPADIDAIVDMETK